MNDVLKKLRLEVEKNYNSKIELLLVLIMFVILYLFFPINNLEIDVENISAIVYLGAFFLYFLWWIWRVKVLPKNKTSKIGILLLTYEEINTKYTKEERETLIKLLNRITCNEFKLYYADERFNYLIDEKYKKKQKKLMKRKNYSFIFVVREHAKGEENISFNLITEQIIFKETLTEKLYRSIKSQVEKLFIKPLVVNYPGDIDNAERQTREFYLKIKYFTGLMRIVSLKLNEATKLFLSCESDLLKIRKLYKIDKSIMFIYDQIPYRLNDITTIGGLIQYAKTDFLSDKEAISLYKKYHNKREEYFVKNMSRIKLPERRKEMNYNRYLSTAIVCLIDEDIDAAFDAICKCHNIYPKVAAHHYSQAFLLAYERKYEKSINVYKQIRSLSKYGDVTPLIIFIKGVLKTRNRNDLVLCTGMIENFWGDKNQGKADLEEFLKYFCNDGVLELIIKNIIN